jgi:hypothetical protein
MPENLVFIFYDVEVTNSKEIEQLAAPSSTGETFSTIKKTSTRKNSSPILRKISPLAYLMISVEPSSALVQFKMWIDKIVNDNEKHGVKHESVGLMAHYGSCHDHILHLRARISNGVELLRLSSDLPEREASRHYT